MNEEQGAREEVLDFVRAVSAYVEWQYESGTDGFPRGGRPAEAASPREAPAASVAASEAGAPARSLAATEAAGPARWPASQQTEGMPPPRVDARSMEPAPPPQHEPAEGAELAPGAERFPMPDFSAPPGTSPPKGKPPTRVEESPRLTPEQRVPRLSVLQEAVQGCTRCGLHQERTQTVFARGNPNAELCFIGEGPGFEEDRDGLPFVGKAGQLLDKMIHAMGLKGDEVYIANVVKCRPPNNRTPEASEMSACLPYLVEQLDVVRPKVIVALGSTALRGLLGSSDGITRARGSWRLYRASIPVMPTFHPAYVLRQPTKEIRGMVWSDLQQVLARLGRAPTKTAPRDEGG